MPKKTMLYRNNLKNREFDKETSQNSHLEQATIVRAQALSEDENYEKKPTLSKTDSSGCFGISKDALFLFVESIRKNVYEKWPSPTPDISNRIDFLTYMPREGIAVEIGVQEGNFAANILKITN